MARLVVALLAPLTGCSDDTTGTPKPCVLPPMSTGLPLLGGDCDPMVPTQCGYPFPSDVYTKADPTSPTGKRVMFGATTLPENTSGMHVDASVFADSDGRV